VTATNILAYEGAKLITVVKSFTVQAHTVLSSSPNNEQTLLTTGGNKLQF
jgi:hypothetical protein